MREIIKQACSDESGQISSPRVQSMILTLTGVLTIIVGFVFLAFGVAGASPYVSLVLGFAFGKGASDLWAAQLKSGKVLAAQATATSSTTTTTATMTATAISVPGAPTSLPPATPATPTTPNPTQPPEPPKATP